MAAEPTPPDHTHYYRQVLHALIDQGADMARIARAVRRCVRMAQHLDDPRPSARPHDPVAHRILARQTAGTSPPLPSPLPSREGRGWVAARAEHSPMNTHANPRKLAPHPIPG